MLVGVDHLAQGGGIYRYIGESIPYTINHSFKTINFGSQVFATRLRTLYAQAELEVLLVTDKDI